RQLNGSLPKRVVKPKALAMPGKAVFSEFDKGSGDRAVSTTMAFAVMLRDLLRDADVGARIVPIIPDEARTFGLDALFRQFGIYASTGQLYTPVDADLQLSYHEAKDGQILEEGITEAGAMASMTAAGTSYSVLGQPMIPFYLFYSMFGFQRVGDLIWAFGDARGRGFLMGATAGRTTLEGEGLQHDDGHSLVLASTHPSLRAYDCAFAYELAAVVADGIRRMYGPEPEDRFYYLTLYNENYPMPALPEGEDEEAVRNGILDGLYRYAPAPPSEEVTGNGRVRRATILFSGPAWSAAMEARDLLAGEWGVAAECWSATSYKALREDALEAERWNRLHPGAPGRQPRVTDLLGGAEGPIVAVTDFMKAVPDQVARWVPGVFRTLGTDGWGRSDARATLRRYFEVDSHHVVLAVLAALAEVGEGKTEEVAEAIRRYGIDPEAPDPVKL
ncbi:MAG TPA: pyruvate dehydrogenase (acetyl-transferring), homodimeric type, partial [Acidimicrobiales bacterium]|nr:pyruvate dehydrogenase (acetyl-transferring), homodimeric type [Acidimicrobiales bacterium]